jgi:hypothetical protein
MLAKKDNNSPYEPKHTPREEVLGHRERQSYGRNFEAYHDAYWHKLLCSDGGSKWWGIYESKILINKKEQLYNKDEKTQVALQDIF